MSEHPHACGENFFPSASSSSWLGTSPRVWGKLAAYDSGLSVGRNIPTRVGKTRAASQRDTAIPEHPHACGENGTRTRENHHYLGISPRVWGKPLESKSCVRVKSEHPHACGENLSTNAVTMAHNGTSPRVWGKRAPNGRPDAARRNIPTRVGKTHQFRCFRRCCQEHPHACGENVQSCFSPASSHGTSPRVWGKLAADGEIADVDRNIPTRVGKTAWLTTRRDTGPEHPHACGENSWTRVAQHTSAGTSPRVWGKRAMRISNKTKSRNIPTRVGKTWLLVSRGLCYTEHPHACGENQLKVCRISARHGTSPRVWGKPRERHGAGRVPRNIPTRVGKTPLKRKAKVRCPEHPHACGENLWRPTAFVVRFRNIPTRVGKTWPECPGVRCDSEHPHACGENRLMG